MIKRLYHATFIQLGLLLLVFGISGIFGVILSRNLARARAEFSPAPIENPLAAENTFGTTVDLTQYADPELFQQLDAMQAAGLVWLRQPIRWAKIEPERGQFRWDALDHAIEAARLRGFKLVAVLETSPAWARPPDTPAETPPREVTDFAAFADAVARRYQNDIAVFQIWHEPNLSAQWGNRYISPAEYTLLLKNAAIRIRAAQPQATIMAASLAPTLEKNNLNLNEPDFLQGMYDAGAAPYFDILGAELFGFHLPVEESTPNPNELNIRRVELLRRVMRANGDTDTPIWATAFGWHALPANWLGAPPPVPSDVPEKQIARTETALTFARRNWDWLGAIFATRWDATGLAADDPARGFALSPTLLPPFERAAHTLPAIATVGDYPATHISGQYSPGWKFAPPVVDIPRPDNTSSAPTLIIPFEGTRLDLRVNRGDFQGYLWVSIDGKPANALPRATGGRAYVVLTDPLRQSANVTVARYLPDEAHTATITAEGGWGQWAISGWTVFREADTRRTEIAFAILGLIFTLTTVGLCWMALSHRRTLWRATLSGWHWMVHRTERFSTWSIAIGMMGAVAGMVFLPGMVALLLLPVLGALMLLRPEAGGMLVTASISFFLAKITLPGITVSVLEMELALLLIAAGGRLLLPATPQSAPPITVLWRLNWFSAGDALALGLVALGGFTTIWAQNRGVALYEWRTVIFGGVVFYFVLRLLPHLSPSAPLPLARRLVDAFVAGAVMHAASAIQHYFVFPQQTITAEGVHRALGYLYGSPNNLALFLERAFPFLLVFSIWGTGFRRWLHIVGLAVVSVAVYLTFSKGTLLLAIPATLVFIALLTGGRQAWLGAGAGLVLLATALIPLSRTARFRNTFSLQPGSTGYARLQLWQSAGQMLREHWLTGLGLDNFLYQYRTRYILPVAWAEPNLSHPHNIVLDFGTRLGAGGIFWLALAQVRFWARAMRGYFTANVPRRHLLLGIMASMIPFLVHGMVDNAFFLVDLGYTFFFSLALVEVLGND